MLNRLVAPGGRVLWIGAHPDDELFVAPLLGALRKTHQASIHFLVATRGERGPCYRPEGCAPDLATVREEEMRNAAAVFDAEVDFLGCRDGSAPEPEQVLFHWSNDAGGEETLHEKVAAVVRRFAPDAILTLDPDHGSTSHADHRAAGMLAMQAIRDVPIWLAETRVQWGSEVHIGTARADAQPFDASPWWDYLIDDLRCHRSQFRPQLVQAFANVPEEERTMYVKRAG